jgi:arabinofuranan 3-O-arabinosyltransferase
MVAGSANSSGIRPHTGRFPEQFGRAAIAAAVAVLAVLAYVPTLLSSRGRMPADTKLYLYLDPGRLIADAPWTFDARQFAGWVPHQVIAYLWPQGPWYWLGDAAGLPDWVVHRLWLGSLFLAAGTGVLWLARRLGLGLPAALAAALVYQLTPYVLPYASRTSAMLLPWAGLGWIVGLTVLAATRSRWRHAALAALVILSVGAVNATALLMVAPAPVLWLLCAAGNGTIAWRRAATTALRIGVLALGVSLWWIAAVAVQGRQGADVLAYSESLESVSYTSTSPEVWRNLGYWLTYIRDIYAPTTSAGRDYMVSGRLVATGFAIVLVGLAGLVTTRWRHNRFAIALVVTGVVLAVGVHPIDDPSPLMDLLLGDRTSGAALALRSSTRAVPLLVLGLALGAAALVEACRGLRLTDRLTLRPVLAATVAVLAVANQPVLTGRRWVDPAIDRDQDPPAAWLDAAAALDDGDTRSRVLQLPGQEFGAFRWGYTVDPPLPGMTDKPLVTRDLLPLGSAPAMDLLYALDDRVQTGTLEPAQLAPIARLLGADTIWVTGDAAFERFRTARPEVVSDLFTAVGVPGTGEPRAFGDPVVNVPALPIVDEEALADPRAGRPIAPVLLVPVEDPVPVVRAKDDVVLVVGSGDGLVDAAAAGLLDGSELVRYTGSLDDAALDAAAAHASALVITDSNRDRAHHWRSSQDVTGMTEDDDPTTADVLRADPADERLPVFGASAAPATVAVQEGPVRARASGR